MTDGQQEQRIVVSIVHGAQAEGDLEAALTSLEQFLKRESTGEGETERPLEDPECKQRTKGGELVTELLYRIAEGVLVEELAATVRAAVTAWLRHWKESHRDGPVQVAEVEVVEPAEPGGATAEDDSATDEA